MSFSTLMYHEIRDEADLNPDAPSPIKVHQDYHDLLPKVLFVTLKNFETQMTYLKDHGYHTLSLEEVTDFYYKNKSLPDKSVLLTFDDCYQSLYHYAYPILQKHGFKAVAFVTTGWLNGEAAPFDPSQSICLSANELDLMSDVFDFANHTDLFHTRTSLESTVLMTSDDLAFAQDLDRCNNHPVIHAQEVFAYPFGLYTTKNVETLKAKGFKLAFTSAGGRNVSTTDPLLLNRNVVPHFMPLDGFIGILAD